MKIFFNNNLFRLTFGIVRIGKIFLDMNTPQKKKKKKFGGGRFKIFKELFLL